MLWVVIEGQLQSNIYWSHWSYRSPYQHGNKKTSRCYLWSTRCIVCKDVLVSWYTAHLVFVCKDVPVSWYTAYLVLNNNQLIILSVFHHKINSLKVRRNYVQKYYSIRHVFLNNVIIFKTKVLPSQVYVTVADFDYHV